jgi:hypothetical protein
MQLSSHGAITIEVTENKPLGQETWGITRDVTISAAIRVDVSSALMTEQHPISEKS